MKKSLIILVILVMIFGMFLGNYKTAQAASLTSVKDTLTRLKENTAADHTFSFVTPTGIDVGDTVTLTFAAGFDISTIDVGDVTIGGNAPASATVLGQVLTITADADTTVAPAATATIVVGITHHVTNPLAHGSYIISIAGTFADSGSLAVGIIDDDQVAVTADIDESLTFTLSSNTAALGTMTTAAVAAAAAITMTINTNAANGYAVTIQDQGSGVAAGLYKSVAPTDLIASATALLAAGTEGYGAQCASGTETCTAPYNVAGNNVGALQRTAQSFVSNTVPVSAVTADLTIKAAISGTTMAGNYADTLTLICTGTF